MSNPRRWLTLRQPAVLATNSPRPVVGPWALVVGVVAGIWLGWWLYADTLSLPFLQEDSPHIRWLSWHTILEPFFTAEGAPDYRPLGKSIIKFWWLVLGRNDAAWLRFHNLAFNALSTALVGTLGCKLDGRAGRYLTGGVAAVLFGAFPFAYQAIPWINNFFYPLVTFLLLLMALFYWEARRRRERRLFFLALLLAFLAPFEIEYGLMAGGLLLMIELVRWIQGRQAGIWVVGPALGLLMNLAFLARSLTIPKETYFFGLPTAERLLQISTYFLQGLIYPLAPLSRELMTPLELSDLAAIALVGVPVLVIFLLYLVRRGQAAVLVAGLLWFALLNFPALVFLNFDYVINSPRLLYPPGPGIVWLWAAFLGTISTELRPRQYRWHHRLVPGLTALFILITLLISVRFVRQRMTQYHMAERPLHAVVAEARTAAPDNDLLVVNLPSWMTPAERTFALGNHGIQLIPFYISIEDLIFAHNGRDHPTQAVQFTNIQAPQPYYYGMLGPKLNYEELRDYLNRSGDVYVAHYGPERIDLRPVGRVTGVQISSPAAVYGDRVALEVADFAADATGIALTLHWHLQAAMNDADYTVLVHLYGPDGGLVAQADGDPLSGLAPFWLWEPGRQLEDRRYLRWPAEAPPGDYRLGIGVYERANGHRLTATAADGTHLADDIFTRPISRP